MKKYMGILPFFLLCCTLFSIHLTSGLYARYTVSESGSNQARVIQFGNVTLTEEGDFNSEKQFVVIPGVCLENQVKVSFTGSESSVYVFVKMQPNEWKANEDDDYTFFYSFHESDNESKKLKWRIDDKEWTRLDKSDCVYYKSLGPNDTLTHVPVIADKGAIEVGDGVTKDEIKQLEDIKLSMKFQAFTVQSNGFANPQEAWKSITKH